MTKHKLISIVVGVMQHRGFHLSRVDLGEEQNKTDVCLFVLYLAATEQTEQETMHFQPVCELFLHVPTLYFLHFNYIYHARSVMSEYVCRCRYETRFVFL